jgi:hypothetical protein
MKSADGAAVEARRGQEVDELMPAHMAAISAADEGFSQPSKTDDSPAVEFEDKVEPPSPQKAIEVIRQLTQDKLQLLSERDAALNLVARYEQHFGELD